MLLVMYENTQRAGRIDAALRRGADGDELSACRDDLSRLRLPHELLRVHDGSLSWRTDTLALLTAVTDINASSADG